MDHDSDRVDRAVEHLHDRPMDNRSPAAPPGCVPETPAEGVEPMAEVPGGPQVDVPAAQGHMPEDDDAKQGP